MPSRSPSRVVCLIFQWSTPGEECLIGPFVPRMTLSTGMDCPDRGEMKRTVARAKKNRSSAAPEQRPRHCTGNQEHRRRLWNCGSAVENKSRSLGSIKSVSVPVNHIHHQRERLRGRGLKQVRGGGRERRCLKVIVRGVQGVVRKIHRHIFRLGIIHQRNAGDYIVRC